jgi:hypothetical protein
MNLQHRAVNPVDNRRVRDERGEVKRASVPRFEERSPVSFMRFFVYRYIIFRILSFNIRQILDKLSKNRQNIECFAKCANMYNKFLNELDTAQKTTAQQTASPQIQPTVAVTPQQPPAPTQKPVPTSKQSIVDASGVLTDSRDGKKYKTVVIGEKRWMANNLDYKPQSGNSWCYNYKDSNCDKYGRLYDWNMAMTVCMAGWHLPSSQEWKKLVVTAGGDKKAGKKLKARSGWGEKGNGTNDYGFYKIC